MTSGSGLSGGRMSWAEAVAGPLAGATCLWQDLDGLHVEAVPSAAPQTSILWGWRADSLLVRVRLDGQTAYVAVHDPAVQQPVPTVPWSPEDGRVAGSAGRGPDPASGGTGAKYEQVVLDAAGGGPVTFVRPAVAGARPGRDA
ncbi:MAG: hypothetical protein ACRDPD_14040 [Streptosporangiaceae bacterium]